MNIKIWPWRICLLQSVETIHKSVIICSQSLFFPHWGTIPLTINTQNNQTEKNTPFLVMITWYPDISSSYSLNRNKSIPGQDQASGVQLHNIELWKQHKLSSCQLTAQVHVHPNDAYFPIYRKQRVSNDKEISAGRSYTKASCLIPEGGCSSHICIGNAFGIMPCVFPILWGHFQS